MRLLIIEDNIELSQSMKTGLEKLGFYVDVANAGCDGEEKAYVNGYDAILLDLNLPDKDGLEILSFLRKSEINVPIIIVTARDEIEQRAMGLDLGADDYVIKPFELIELRARIQAVIRRFHGKTNPIITVGAITVNPTTREVKFDDCNVVLRAKEFDILEYLAQRYPAIVSAEELVEHVYDETFDPFSSVLRVHIARTRKKLMDVAGHDIIQTIRGQGYSICAK